MQQRLACCSIVKITAFVPEHEIGYKGGAGCDVLSQLLVFICQQCKPAKRKARNQHDYQCRKDAPDAPTVKFCKAEAFAIEAVEYDRGNKETRNDEENVDADKAAPDQMWKCVKADNR